MSFVTTRIPRLAAGLFLGFLAMSLTSAKAQNAHNIVLKSLVYIEATGIKTTMEPLKAVGTGTIIDKDGLILTSYHLIGFLEANNAAAQSVEIKVSIGNKTGPFVPAQVVDAKSSVDLLLLQISPEDAPGGKVEPLPLGQMSDIPNTTSAKLLTSGFRGSAVSPSRVQTEADVKSRSGPRGFTWVIDKPVDAGQSGSPVYIQTENGGVKLVGVVKGTIENGTDTIFVPISSAETLLLPIRMRELNERIAKLGDKPFDSQMVGYLGTQGESTPLGSWFNSYIEAHIDQKVDTFLNKYKANIDHRLDGYMKDVVAYSYSSQFSFSGKKDGSEPYYTLPFYKAEGDEGNIKCNVDYGRIRPKADKPVNEINVKTLYKLNDLQPGEIQNPYPRPTNTLDVKLVEKNKFNYYGLDGPNAQEPSAYQQIDFWITRGEEFDGQITFTCTVLIMGSAKLAKHK